MSLSDFANVRHSMRADLRSVLDGRTVPIYMVAVCFILVIPFSSDYFKERPIHLSIATTIAAASFAVCLGSNNHIVQYVFLCFAVGGIYAAPPLALTWTSNVISWPSEKRAVTQAFVK